MTQPSIEQLRDSLNKIRGRQQLAQEQFDKAMDAMRERFGINSLDEAVDKAQEIMLSIDQIEAERDKAIDKARNIISRMLSEAE
jgi:hypothetical protein